MKTGRLVSRAASGPIGLRRSFCAGVGLETLADTGGNFQLAVPVTADAPTVLHASATDAAGNVSTCSVGLTYVNDISAPAAPTLSTIDPAPVANHNAPLFRGTAEPGSVVTRDVPERARILGNPARVIGST